MLTRPKTEVLRQGLVIPAHPLAWTRKSGFDARVQQQISDYYLAAGAGGLAVGVHTTQFEIHDTKVGLYQPVLEVSSQAVKEFGNESILRIAGVIGQTRQAVAEAELARSLGYDAALLSLSAWRGFSERDVIEHCQIIAEVLPLFGFYLQPAVGGIELPYTFWRRFAEIDNVIAIKIAAFDRYRTLDVVRAVVDAGRSDIALYTGNDDQIVLDLVTPYQLLPESQGEKVSRRMVGGLLGHWAFSTRKAVELLQRCQTERESGQISPGLLALSHQVTDINAAVFDAANSFRGCVPGIHEMLHRQGVVPPLQCLSGDTLSPGQKREIDRVVRSYPHLVEQ